MLRVIQSDHFNVFGFAGGTSDIGTDGANLPKGTYYDKPIASTSYAIDVDTDDSYTFNETTQTWRKQA